MDFVIIYPAKNVFAILVTQKSKLLKSKIAILQNLPFYTFRIFCLHFAKKCIFDQFSNIYHFSARRCVGDVTKLAITQNFSNGIGQIFHRWCTYSCFFFTYPSKTHPPVFPLQKKTAIVFWRATFFNFFHFSIRVTKLVTKLLPQLLFQHQLKTRCWRCTISMKWVNILESTTKIPKVSVFSRIWPTFPARVQGFNDFRSKVAIQGPPTEYETTPLSSA